MMKKMKINKLKVSVENSIFDVLNHEQELLVMNEWIFLVGIILWLVVNIPFTQCFSNSIPLLALYFHDFNLLNVNLRWWVHSSPSECAIIKWMKT